MAKKAKVQKEKPAPTIDRHVGGYGSLLIISDTNGKLWRLDMETGHACPVKFEAASR